MRLCDIKPPKGSVKKRKKVGRGNGSGHGTTSGRGTKGQLARSGGKTRIGFEGGQMPLQRRIPYLRGFRNARKIEFNVINVGQLDSFDSNIVIDSNLLREKGIIRKREFPLKVLGNGKLTKEITVKADKFSKSAIDKIKKAGGKAEVV